MQLVIAEKPSVGRDLARVLGVKASGRNALEGAGRVITWCIGHLVELEEPAAYDGRWKAWRMDTLPMIPQSFKLRPVAGTRDQLRVVCDLLRERRFTEVVNACDAGREGELIFRYVYELAGSVLPVRRLWISSLTDEAIRQGLAALRPGAAYDPLADAARSRSEADWLVGMNATRAVTMQFRAAGEGRNAPRGATSAMPAVYSIGRVQTPTLAILVRREQAIRAFQPRDYWEVRGTFSAGTAQTFTALWSTRPEPGRGAITRFAARGLADQVVARAAAAAAAPQDHGGGAVVESLTQKQSREPPPQLFDLTALQRTANRRYGFSATRTLQAAQALYERHKVLTYPRTDSRYLPRELVDELPKLFAGLAKLPSYREFSEPLLGANLGELGRSRRIFDAAKVHDHHAIIPTAKVPTGGALGQDEQRIYDLVVRRFLGAFHPDAEFALTEAVIRVGAAAVVSAGAAALDPAVHAARAPVVPSRPAPGSADSAAAPPSSSSSPPPDEPMLGMLPAPPDRFVARGRVRLVAGWQAVAGFDERSATTAAPAPPRATGAGVPGQEDKRGGGTKEATEPMLPALAKGQRLGGRFEALAHQTRPPPRHTEATLLGAMESAGREMEDQALRAAMKDTGLGTPATRAATIETLVKRGFISRDGKQVVPTATGIALITMIERLPVATLASPELTGAWEARLVRIARGEETRAAFMTDIVAYVRDVTAAVRAGMRDAPAASAVPYNARPAPVALAAPIRPSGARPPARGKPPRKRAATPRTARAPVSLKKGAGESAGGGVADLVCPRCRQGALMAGKRGWGCSRWREGCPFVVWFEAAGKRITDGQLRDLVKKGQTRKFTRNKAGPAVSSSGRLVLDLTAPRETGGARFSPE